MTLTLTLTFTLTLDRTLALTPTLTRSLARALTRRALRVGHVPRPDVGGGGRQVGLVQRPRRLRRGSVPVRRGVGLARVRRERAMASNFGWRRRVTTPVRLWALRCHSYSESHVCIFYANGHGASALLGPDMRA